MKTCMPPTALKLGEGHSGGWREWRRYMVAPCPPNLRPIMARSCQRLHSALGWGQGQPKTFINRPYKSSLAGTVPISASRGCRRSVNKCRSDASARRELMAVCHMSFFIAGSKKRQVLAEILSKRPSSKPTPVETIANSPSRSPCLVSISTSTIPIGFLSTGSIITFAEYQEPKWPVLVAINVALGEWVALIRRIAGKSHQPSGARVA